MQCVFDGLPTIGVLPCHMIYLIGGHFMERIADVEKEMVKEIDWIKAQRLHPGLQRYNKSIF